MGQKRQIYFFRLTSTKTTVTQPNVYIINIIRETNLTSLFVPGITRLPVLEGEVSHVEIPRTSSALGITIVGGADTPLVRRRFYSTLKHFDAALDLPMWKLSLTFEQDQGHQTALHLFFERCLSERRLSEQRLTE